MTKQSKKESKTKGSRWWGLLVFGLLVLIDQLTKLFAEVYFLAGNPPIEIIPNWIALTLAYNDGIAYGIGSDASAGVKMAVIATTAVMMLLLTLAYCVMDKRRAFLRIAFIFVVAGGVGNLIDRAYFRVWETSLAFLAQVYKSLAFAGRLCGKHQNSAPIRQRKIYRRFCPDDWESIFFTKFV